MAIYKSGNLQNLLKVFLKNILSDSHNCDRVMFSFSSYELTDDKKTFFVKAQFFSKALSDWILKVSTIFWVVILQNEMWEFLQ